MRRCAAGLLIALPVLAISATAAGAKRVPTGFVGAMVDGPMFSPRVNLPKQLAIMEASGVESIRVSFDWALAQPYAHWQDVPEYSPIRFDNGPGDVPTDYSATDRIIRLAAGVGMRVLPTVIYAPSWDVVGGGALVEPQSPGPYASYLTALVERYGPHGSFWRENPRVPYFPVRHWQVWNEPTLTCCFWTTRPFTRTYIPLLRAAHDALKKADPGARLVLAGFPNDSWDAVEQIYGVRGARRLFDEVAVHPYTRSPRAVIKILSLVRDVMRRNGDGAKPLLATEVGWPSSLGQTPVTFGIATTPAGQAAKLRVLLPQLSRQRKRLGLAGFYLYTWMGEEFRGAATFAFSGLLRWIASERKIQIKPAFHVFRAAALALEGCRVKGSLASVCEVPVRRGHRT